MKKIFKELILIRLYSVNLGLDMTTESWTAFWSLPTCANPNPYTLHSFSPLICFHGLKSIIILHY